MSELYFWSAKDEHFCIMLLILCVSEMKEISPVEWVFSLAVVWTSFIQLGSAVCIKKDNDGTQEVYIGLWYQHLQLICQRSFRYVLSWYLIENGMYKLTCSHPFRSSNWCRVSLKCIYHYSRDPKKNYIFWQCNSSYSWGSRRIIIFSKKTEE